MKLVFILLLVPTTFATAAAPKFIGKWAAISKACVPDSILEIKKDELKYQGNKPKKFKVVKQNETSDWLEITSKLECAVSCEDKFYRLTRDGEDRLEVASNGKLDSSEGWSQCWYVKK